MAAEVITIDSSSDDDSPPPIKRSHPTSTTSNKAPAPSTSYGSSSAHQRRPSSSNAPPQPAASASTSKTGGGSFITARKSSGMKTSGGSGNAARAEASKTAASVQLALSGSSEDEDHEIANALRPADKGNNRTPTDSGDDDPIAIRPSPSPSKARPSSTASPARKSAAPARKPSSSNQRTSQTPPAAQTAQSKPSGTTLRRPSPTRPGVATNVSSSTFAKPTSHRESSPQHSSNSIGRAPPMPSSDPVSHPHRRFSAPTSTQSGRRIPRKKRISMQEGGEGSSYVDRLSSPSPDIMEQDARPQEQGGSARAALGVAATIETIDLISDDDDDLGAGATAPQMLPEQNEVASQVKDEAILPVEDEDLDRGRTDIARGSATTHDQGHKRSSTSSTLTPPSPPKRRLSASHSAATTEIQTQSLGSEVEPEHRRPPPRDTQPGPRSSPAPVRNGSTTTAEDDQIDELDEEDEEVTHHQQSQSQTSSDDEMQVDESDDLELSPELGLPTFAAAEKGKSQAMQTDQDDSVLMPPPPLPSKRLFPGVATTFELAEGSRVASALSDTTTPRAAPPSRSTGTARKSSGTPLKAGYARKSTGRASGAPLARKSAMAKPKPVAHASLPGTGRREKGMTWDELVDLTMSTDEEDDGSEDAENDEEEIEEAEGVEQEESQQPSPMVTDVAMALPDVMEREEPAAAEEPSELAQELADMAVTEEGATAAFVEETINYTRDVTLRMSADGAVAAQEHVEVVSSRRTRSANRPAPPPPTVKPGRLAKKDGAQAVEPAPAETPVETPVETPAEMERRAQAFMDRERSTRSSWRQIAGPSFAGEEQEIEESVRHVQLRDRRHRWANGDGAALISDPDDTAHLENLIAESDHAHLPRAAGDLPRVRIIPTADGLPPYTPPWECVWTHRVRYPPNVPPTQAPGCGCEGDCGSPENEAACACRLRQQRASTVKALVHDPMARSGITSFAYTEEGLVKPELFENPSMEPIIECNAECGCDESCINRVVGKIPSVSVDIVNTGQKGWAIRNPPSYTYRLWPEGEELQYEGRVIKKGTPMGIYASEMLPYKDGDQRCEDLYNDVGRNYLFGLDHTAILEELRLQAPDLRDAARAAQEAADAAATASRGARSKKKSKQSEKARLASSKDGRRQLREMGKEAFDAMTREEEEDDGKPDSTEVEPAFMLDAFFYGNWTRFANHSCSRFNTAVCPVFVDEADWSRPLYVFIASSDIQPGEEIAITYHGHRPELDGLDLATYKKQANLQRREADKSWRCFCGEDLCRGVMFSGYAAEAEDDEVEEEAAAVRSKLKKKGKGRRH